MKIVVFRAEDERLHVLQMMDGGIEHELSLGQAERSQQAGRTGSQYDTDFPH
jgi:hypothetical protein